jgi:DNA-binding NarL/FixJ family response regulator
MQNLTIVDPFKLLSKRETEVLQFMLQGIQVKGISAALGLKSNTISTFKKSFFQKQG